MGISLTTTIDCIVFLIQLLDKFISLLYCVHKFLDIHLNGKFAVCVESAEEIFAEEPAVPWVHSSAFLLLDDAEVELIAITTFQEERARNLVVTFWWALNEDLFLSCLYVAQIHELRVIKF